MLCFHQPGNPAFPEEFFNNIMVCIKFLPNRIRIRCAEIEFCLLYHPCDLSICRHIMNMHLLSFAKRAREHDLIALYFHIGCIVHCHTNTVYQYRASKNGEEKQYRYKAIFE